MGLHFQITRERQGVKSDIPLDDWIAFVRASPDLNFETPVGDDADSKFARSIHSARWSGFDGAWLGWSNGEIWTKNPSEELVRYMISIAPRFGARVQGGEGEFYRTAEDAYFEQEGQEVTWQEQERRRVAEVAKYKRKQLIIKCIMVVIMVVALYRLIRKHLL
jgi:hypothetical protein